MNNFKLKVFVFSLLAILGNSKVNAQLVSADVFLKGDYVEVGVCANGAFGSGANAPTGYHPKGDTKMGFVADSDKDGWSSGTPTYFGDYFLPGSPHEGWDIQIDGARSAGWRNYGTGFSGTAGLTGSNTSYSVIGKTKVGVWDGSIGSLTIQQKTILDTSKLYFVMEVKLKNTGAVTLNNIYYNRLVDPDNEVTTSASTYTTYNRIAFKPSSTSNKALVSARGNTFTRSYLGLGTVDCRAKAYMITDFSKTYSANTASVYAETATGYNLNLGDSMYVDNLIGLVFNIGNLAAGDSTILKYAYILKQEDLDSAFQNIKATWLYDGNVFNSKDTINVPCGTSSINLSLINGGAYTWGAWSPTTGLSSTSGTTNTITLGSSPITYRVVGSASSTSCATNDTMFITINPGGGSSTAPTVTSPLNLCVGGPSATLTASGTGLKWYTTATGGTGATTAPTISTSSSSTATYYVSQGSPACESARSAIVVNVNALPTAPTVTTPVNLCVGGAGTTLTATGSNLKWYTVSSGGTALASAPSITTATASTVTYYVSQSLAASSGGCEGTRSAINVNVNNIPAAPTVSSPLKICLNTTATSLTATGTSLKWYSTATGGTGSATAPTPTTTTTGNTDYFVSQTVAFCESPRATLTATINPLPSVSISSLSASGFVYCGGKLINLKATSSTAKSYQWMFAGSPITAATLDTIFIGKAGKWSVVVKDSNNCQGQDSVLIKRDSSLIPVLSPTELFICEESSALLTCHPGFVGYDFKWLKDELPIVGASSSSNLFGASNAGIYKVVVTNAKGCVDTTNASIINYYPKPFKPTVINKNPLLEVPSAGYIYFQWYRNAVKLIGANAHKYSVLSDGDYYVEVTDANGCLNNSDTVKIKQGTGIQAAHLAAQIKMYPNPTQSKLFIESPFSVNAQVFDMIGKLILSAKNVVEIDLGNCADAHYFIRITDDEGKHVLTQKITKQSN